VLEGAVCIQTHRSCCRNTETVRLNQPPKIQWSEIPLYVRCLTSIEIVGRRCRDGRSAANASEVLGLNRVSRYHGVAVPKTHKRANVRRRVLDLLRNCRGGMAEWSMAVVLKTTEPETVPGVRIPLPPPPSVCRRAPSVAARVVFGHHAARRSRRFRPESSLATNF
jgi:hypothetical protein